MLQHILENMALCDDTSVISRFTCNIISGVAQIAKNKGMECLAVALCAPDLSASSIDFIASVGLDDALMRRSIEYLQNDTVEPHWVLVIAINANLQTVNDKLIELLVRTLLSKHVAGAWAAVYFLDPMLLALTPGKEH